ncbi:transmembrane protein 237 [Lepeophtheirus salmonis]|uniref:transmembrane protein 237 n=1 Tax=Lepeophtheirus salmonis TaxID=72036 RepID=UPI001AEAD8C3|nr:transmembrane protein 237-like [Lepeophtheirus salmonis]
MTDDVEITEIKRSSGLLPLPIEDIKKKKKNSKSKKRREEKEQLSPPVKGSQIFSNKKETEGITVNDVDDKPESSSPKQSEDDDLKRFENIKVSTNDEKKKKSKNTRRKKKKISDSTFSLENDFQPEVLRDLQDDIQSDDNFSIHPDEWNPHLHPRVLTPSKLSSKIYVEKNHGFTNVSQKKVIASQLAFISDGPIESGPHKSKVRSTPIELALETQKMFHSLCIFCHGLLGGIAFWQILTVHVPGESGLKFARNYSPMSQPLQVIFYLLTAICTVSVFDR